MERMVHFGGGRSSGKTDAMLREHREQDFERLYLQGWVAPPLDESADALRFEGQKRHCFYGVDLSREPDRLGVVVTVSGRRGVPSRNEIEIAKREAERLFPGASVVVLADTRSIVDRRPSARMRRFLAEH